ncbi:hypothetical protein ACQPXM_15930 [Kribbella sp. CA-253562]|uniref:hypothetical protein n=1 Tax=Kribbella sp. CA-253562 TaxID=3239942 RepID=UPI003D94F81B
MVTPDVLVLGEILVELSSTEPLDAGTQLTLNFSGDALNAAAASAAAGAKTARLVLGDKLLGAVRLGVAAASLSVGGLGGTGHVPTLDQIQAHAATTEVTA